MKMQNHLIKWLIFIAALLSPLGLQAQTFLSGDWTQGNPAVTVGVDTNGTLLATAPLNSSVTFNSAENSTTNPQFLWVPALAAFRAGMFYWAASTTTMGQYSAAFGYSLASGQSSFASGESYASGYSSTALGDSSATNDGATAMGFGAEADGYSATAIGFFVWAGGSSSVAIGGGDAEGDYSVSLGSGWASGTGSIALGQGEATGNYAVAMGQTTAPSYGEVAIGQNNIGNSTSATSWVLTDPLFEIGNGTGTGSTPNSDALIVYKNGNAVFSPPGGTPTPPAGTPSCTVTAPGFVTTTASGDIPMYTGN